MHPISPFNDKWGLDGESAADLKDMTKMISMMTRDRFLEIRPVTQGDLEAILEVYQQCEDFLALGPVATASMEMVLKDIEISKNEGGIFSGIYTADGKMIGVVDYVPNNYQANPETAFLSLLMIAAPFRSQGIGNAVVDAVEKEIGKDAQINVILSGVQVNNPQAIRFWQRNGYRIVSEPRLHPDQTTAVDLRKEIRQKQGREEILNLRRAQVNDVHKLAQVHVDAWQAAYQGIVPDAFLRQFTYQKREQAFRHALEAKLEETYLLEEDDSAIAILTIGPCRDEDLDAKRTGEIWGIYISPSYWRRGIGSNLLDEAERLLKARGLQDIVLWVLEENTAARAFYEAMGFHLDGASKTVVLGNPLKVVRYAKTLNSDMDKCKYE